jgi:hypothetical protein
MGERMPIPAAEQLQLLNGYAENYMLFTSGVGSAPIAEFGRRQVDHGSILALPGRWWGIGRRKRS